MILMVVLDFLQTLFFATEHGVVSECPVRVAMWSALRSGLKVAMYFLNRILCKCIEGLLGKQSSTICTERKTLIEDGTHGGQGLVQNLCLAIQHGVFENGRVCCKRAQHYIRVAGWQCAFWIGYCL